MEFPLKEAAQHIKSETRQGLREAGKDPLLRGQTWERISSDSARFFEHFASHHAARPPAVLRPCD